MRATAALYGRNARTMPATISESHPTASGAGVPRQAPRPPQGKAPHAGPGARVRRVHRVAMCGGIRARASPNATAAVAVAISLAACRRARRTLRWRVRRQLVGRLRAGYGLRKRTDGLGNVPSRATYRKRLGRSARRPHGTRRQQSLGQRRRQHLHRSRNLRRRLDAAVDRVLLRSALRRRQGRFVRRPHQHRERLRRVVDLLGKRFALLLVPKQRHLRDAHRGTDR